MSDTRTMNERIYDRVHESMPPCRERTLALRLIARAGYRAGAWGSYQYEHERPVNRCVVCNKPIPEPATRCSQACWLNQALESVELRQTRAILSGERLPLDNKQIERVRPYAPGVGTESQRVSKPGYMYTDQFHYEGSK